VFEEGEMKPVGRVRGGKDISRRRSASGVGINVGSLGTNEYDISAAERS
jgi:hypothetical protein